MEGRIAEVGVVMEYSGKNGQISVNTESATITITREGFVARGSFPKSEPRIIPFKAISGVELRKSSLLLVGSLTVGIHGNPVPDVSGSGTVHMDSVTFANKQSDSFGQLHDFMADVVATNSAEGVDHSAYPVSGGATDRLTKSHEKIAALNARVPDIQSANWGDGGLFSGQSHDLGKDAKVTLSAEDAEIRNSEAALRSATVGGSAGQISVPGDEEGVVHRSPHHTDQRNEILTNQSVDNDAKVALEKRLAQRAKRDTLVAGARQKSADRKMAADFNGHRIKSDGDYRHRSLRVPVAGATAVAESGANLDRRTGTRIIGGAILFGPAGAIVGGMLKKKKTKFYVTVTFKNGDAAIIETPLKDERKARSFAAAVNRAGVHFANRAV